MGSLSMAVAAPLSLVNAAAGTVPFSVQAASGQTAHVLDVLNSSGTPVCYVTSSGALTSNNNITANFVPNPFIIDGTSTGPYFQFGTSTITLNARSAAKIGLTVQAAASQTADLTDWVKSDGTTIVASVDANGNIKCNTLQPGTLDTMTYAATITLTTTAGEVHETTTVNATGNATINASSGGVAGQRMTVVIVNDATSGKTITFGTSFRANGTLSGTASKAATVSFISDGVSWFEIGRQTGL